MYCFANHGIIPSSLYHYSMYHREKNLEVIARETARAKARFNDEERKRMEEEGQMDKTKAPEDDPELRELEDAFFAQTTVED